jgi:small conductance mechanosensitive channel
MTLLSTQLFTQLSSPKVAAGAFLEQDGSTIDEFIDTTSVSGWDVVIGVAILVLMFPLSSAVSWIVGRIIRKSQMPDAVRLLIKRLARSAVIIIGVAVAVSLMGVSVQWFTVVVVFIGLVAVLMLRPLVENFSAGLLLEVRGSFVVGDEIESNGHEGEVQVINGRTTVLQTRDGRRVAIPSTEVLDSSIIIYTAFEKRRSSLTVDIEYRADLDAAEAALLDAASSAAGVLDDPAPSVRARDFGSGTYQLDLRWWHGPRLSDESQARDRVVRNVKQQLDAAGIAMPSPERIIRQPDLPDD